MGKLFKNKDVLFNLSVRGELLICWSRSFAPNVLIL